MEDKKYGLVLQGDINGVGYEVILKAFADPVMLELCTRLFTVRLKWLLIIKSLDFAD